MNINYDILGIIVGGILLILAIIRIRSLFKLAGEICDQTLKNDKGLWSMPRIMMVVAFHACLIVFFYDAYKEKKLNEMAFGMMLTVALGGKVADSYSKKLAPPTTPEKNENNTNI